MTYTKELCQNSSVSANAIRFSGNVDVGDVCNFTLNSSLSAREYSSIYGVIRILRFYKDPASNNCSFFFRIFSHGHAEYFSEISFLNNVYDELILPLLNYHYEGGVQIYFTIFGQPGSSCQTYFAMDFTSLVDTNRLHPNEYFECTQNGVAISINLVCNDMSNCPSNDDELFCENRSIRLTIILLIFGMIFILTILFCFIIFILFHHKFIVWLRKTFPNYRRKIKIPKYYLPSVLKELKIVREEILRQYDLKYNFSKNVLLSGFDVKKKHPTLWYTQVRKYAGDEYDTSAIEAKLKKLKSSKKKSSRSIFSSYRSHRKNHEMKKAAKKNNNLTVNVNNLLLTGGLIRGGSARRIDEVEKWTVNNNDQDQLIVPASFSSSPSSSSLRRRCLSMEMISLNGSRNSYSDISEFDSDFSNYYD